MMHGFEWRLQYYSTFFLSRTIKYEDILLYFIVNWISLLFWLLVRKNKEQEDLTLVCPHCRKMWCSFFHDYMYSNFESHGINATYWKSRKPGYNTEHLILFDFGGNAAALREASDLWRQSPPPNFSVVKVTRLFLFSSDSTSWSW